MRILSRVLILISAEKGSCVLVAHRFNVLHRVLTGRRVIISGVDCILS